MSKIIFHTRIIHTWNQIIKLFAVPWNTCYYEELEPGEIQNIKTSTAFLKIGKHIEKEKVNLSDLTLKFIFFKIESIFCEPFPKNIKSILSVYLHSLLDK